LQEFANKNGVAAIAQVTVDSLQRTRDMLGATRQDEARIIITGGCRTQTDNERLAKKFGWTEDGGKVSRNSQHLISMGANGVDFFAIDTMGEKIPTSYVAAVARRYFSFVKTYKDGHIHADCRVPNDRSRQDTP
tara:strand:+ start:219 stop:620 length:402 start_codon:yes stop_codon:yes gene_type:complete